MPDYKLVFDLRSSIQTPFHADTIFGHIAWAYRYLRGEDELLKWLNKSKTNPTLVSNAFPVGYMPKPVLKPAPLHLFENNPDFQKYTKKIKKIDLIAEDWIAENRKNLNATVLIEHLLKTVKDDSKLEEKSILIPHSSYNRQSGRTLEGFLYDTEETFFQPGKFWFYFSSDTIDSALLEKILEYIALDGFGADKSVGKGMVSDFKIEKVDIQQPAKTNAVMSLSNFIPAKKNEINGYYQTMTKFGKLSAGFGSGYNPFKKPVIMLKAGSVIKDNDFHSGKIYGQLQGDVHTNPDIVQYGYVFPWPVYIAEQEYESEYI